MRRSVTILLAWCLVLASCASSPTTPSPALGEATAETAADGQSSSSSSQVVIDVPGGGATLSVDSSDRAANLQVARLSVDEIPDGPDNSHESIGFAIDITDPDGDQPDGLIELLVDGRSVDFENPEAVSFGRWDEESELWVPHHTTWDPERNVFVVRVRHFSLSSAWEFFEDEVVAPTGRTIDRAIDAAGDAADQAVQAASDVAAEVDEGARELVTWTGEQWRDFSNSVATYAEVIGDFAVEDVASFAGLNQSEPPDCSGPPTEFEYGLTEGLLEANPPIQICLTEFDGQPVLRIVNNRPFGMTVDLPSGSGLTEIRNELVGSEAVLPLDGDQALELMFQGFDWLASDHEVFGYEINLENDAFYLPARASVDVLLPLRADETDRTVSVSFDSFVGFVFMDLAIETALLVPTTARAVVEAVRCFNAFIETSERSQRAEAPEVLNTALGVVGCLQRLGFEVLATAVTWGIEVLLTLIETVQFAFDSSWFELSERAEVSAAGSTVATAAPNQTFVCNSPTADAEAITARLFADGRQELYEQYYDEYLEEVGGEENWGRTGDGAVPSVFWVDGAQEAAAAALSDLFTECESADYGWSVVESMSLVQPSWHVMTDILQDEIYKLEIEATGIETGAQLGAVGLPTPNDRPIDIDSYCQARGGAVKSRGDTGADIAFNNWACVNFIDFPIDLDDVCIQQGSEASRARPLDPSDADSWVCQISPPCDLDLPCSQITLMNMLTVASITDDQARVLTMTGGQDLGIGANASEWVDIRCSTVGSCSAFNQVGDVQWLIDTEWIPGTGFIVSQVEGFTVESLTD